MRALQDWLRALRPKRIDPDVTARIRGWALANLDAESDTTISVNEIACRDPACPGVETIILVMRSGQRTRACKVAKAIEDVTEADVRAALSD
jgi:hypothetical protein